MDISALFDSRLFHFLREDPVTAALIDILSDPIQDTFDVCEYIANNQSISAADGEQLELLGELIGVKRPLAQEDHIFTIRKLGFSGDPDNKTGWANDDDATVTTGGYITSSDGLYSQRSPGTEMSDTDYRYLIRQKAASYRSKMTHQVLFEYLIAFGTKCLIDDDTRFVVELDPLDYYAINGWAKNYVVTKGFKPAGIKVQFADNVRDGDTI